MAVAPACTASTSVILYLFKFTSLISLVPQALPGHPHTPDSLNWGSAFTHSLELNEFAIVVILAVQYRLAHSCIVKLLQKQERVANLNAEMRCQGLVGNRRYNFTRGEGNLYSSLMQSLVEGPVFCTLLQRCRIGSKETFR